MPTSLCSSVLGMWTIAWLLVSDKIIGDHRLQHFLRNNFYQHPVELEHVTSTDATT